MDRGSQLDKEDEADEEAEDEEEKEKEKEREEEEKRKAADIKSNNPHLAGGEKEQVHVVHGRLHLDCSALNKHCPTGIPAQLADCFSGFTSSSQPIGFSRFPEKMCQKTTPQKKCLICRTRLASGKPTSLSKSPLLIGKSTN